MTDYNEVRERWQPAPGSRLAEALGKAEEAAAQWSEVRGRVASAQAERAAVQRRLDAVQLGSDAAAVAGDIGAAQALDLIIMRGQVEMNRLRMAWVAVDGDVQSICTTLLAYERPVDDARRRWGDNSEEVAKERRARSAGHMRYLATPATVS